MLFDKKGNGEVSTKELASVFKGLGLQVEDGKLKEWADDADEEGEACSSVKVKDISLICSCPETLHRKAGIWSPGGRA